MKIVIVHYHLKTGGVTTVIKQQIEAISTFAECLIITGEEPEEPVAAKTVCIPDIAYDSVIEQPGIPEKVALSIVETINSHWHGGCDIIHVHNPTLAKNRNFLKILKSLQDRKQTLFLQIHDFAEDGRPLSYYNESYPKNCHYGAISRRDHQTLLDAGLTESGTHLITNALTPASHPRKTKSGHSHVIYPVRAIRRKNIGEAILVSLFFANELPLLITLPPNSAEDIKSYQFWKQFVEIHGLKVMFDAGLEQDFSSLVDTAEFVLSTSITEGFGFAFIEPWLYGKSIWGRYLPGICSGFEKAGIILSHLYQRLVLPLDWIAVEDFYREWLQCIYEAFDKYNQPVATCAIEQAFGKMTLNHTIDFSVLNERYQKEVIEIVIKSDPQKKRLLQLNPFLASPGKIKNSKRVIRENQNTIKKHFDPSLYAKTLEKVYRQILQTSVQQSINTDQVANIFLNPEGFSLLKWGTFKDL